MGKAIIMVFFVGAFLVFSFIKLAGRGVKAAYLAVNEPSNESSKVDRAVSLSIMMLSFQKMMMSNGGEVLPAKACDEWSLGYVGGMTDGILQSLNLGPEDTDSYIVMSLVFEDTYGKSKSMDYLEKFMDLSSHRSGDLMVGRDEAFKELKAFSSKSGEPAGLGAWLMHVNS